MLAEDERARLPQAYGPNFERLAALKKKWDPENLFRMNHNIAPTG
jgi:FAD/FMN-containing dehydrogenase